MGTGLWPEWAAMKRSWEVKASKQQRRGQVCGGPGVWGPRWAGTQVCEGRCVWGPRCVETQVCGDPGVRGTRCVWGPRCARTQLGDPGVWGPSWGAQVCGDPGVQGPRCAGSLHLLTSVLPPPLRGAFAMTVMIKDQEETPWQIYSAPKLGWATELN